MAYVAIDEAAGLVRVYSSEDAYLAGRAELGAADLRDRQEYGPVWVDRSAHVRHFPPQWSSDVDKYATAALRAAMRRAALLDELHALAVRHADETEPDYPFTTGPRDWYDGGEPDDERDPGVGEYGPNDRTAEDVAREMDGPEGHEDVSESCPTSHEWRAICSCGWAETGARHGDPAWCAAETRRMWEAHVFATSIADATGRPADDPQVAGLARALGYCAS